MKHSTAAHVARRIIDSPKALCKVHGSCAIEEFFESPLLRLDGIELTHDTRDRVKWLAWLFLGWTYWLASGVAPQPDRYVSQRPPCQHCGGMLHLIAITDASGRILVSRALPQPPLANHTTNYLDSG